MNEIWTLQDLENFQQEVNSGRTGGTYYLMADIDMGVRYNVNTRGWTTIGNANTPFRGKFIGNGHVIKNLYLNYRDVNGFFGVTYNAVITGIQFVDTYIKTPDIIHNVGVVVGTAQGNTIIKECFASGIINATVGNGGNIGGIVGSCWYNKTIIKDCFTNVHISTGSTSRKVGGIVGNNNGTADIENCYSIGNIQSTQPIGGVHAGNNIICKNSIAASNSLNTTAGSLKVGRISAEEADNTFINCYALNTMLLNNVTVSGVETNKDGLNKTKAELNQQAFYETMGWNFVDVWKMSYPDGPYRGYPIFTWMRNPKANEIWTNMDLLNFRDAIEAGNTFEGVTHKVMADIDMSMIQNFYMTKEYRGTFDGGFKTISNFKSTVGFFKAISGIVKNVILKGNVVADATSNTAALFGDGLSGTLENCYAEGIADGRNSKPNISHYIGGLVSGVSGTVRNCISNVQVYGGNRVGGITAILLNGGTIENSYAIGQVNGDEVYVGGITAYTWTGGGTVKNCVALMPKINVNMNNGVKRILGYTYSGTSLQNNLALDSMLIAGQIVAGGTAINNDGLNKTMAELKLQSTYQSIGWDFTSVWKMSAANSPFKGYPVLKWMNA